MKKKSQDYSAYYQGEVPSYQIGGQIDYSQISSMFSRASETMSLVYQYAPNISQDVSYIFDFSNAGAYGVYIPKLVEDIKTNELKNRLESKGYTIDQQDGVLVAYPENREIPQEEVQQEIKQLWDEINAGKTEVLGVNMNKVKSSTQEVMRGIVSNAENQGMPIANPQLLWDMLIMLELGATIVHEWEHSRGGDEGAAESREKDFASKMLSVIKQKYETEVGEPMPIGDLTASKHKNWYRFAQFMGYIPRSFSSKPTGNDLEMMGRGKSWSTDSALSNWGLITQKHQSTPIESRLGRDFMWPLDPEIRQEHDIIEDQLRKQTRNDNPPNPYVIYEELLEKDRDNEVGYKTLEQLMEEKRPQPLMVPLEKSASLSKQATLFGWYNHLEISDGSTIPGLGDRVMEWDDRDESFVEEESWIRSQPRYNPTYDLKGFYYRWIEPRFKPQLWDSMIQDNSNTHPARRFASIPEDMNQIIKVITCIREKILKGEIKSSRLVISEDLCKFIFNFFENSDLETKVFRFGENSKDENIYSMWVFDSSIDKKLIRDAESRFQFNKNDSDDLIEDLLGLRHCKTKAINEIIDCAKEICSKNNIDDLYLVGAYAREKYMGVENPDVESLDFTTRSRMDNFNVGSLMSKKLGVDFVLGGDLRFAYKGINVEFSITKENADVKRLNSIKCKKPNQLTIELLRKDFTLNMFVYNICTDTVGDPLKVAEKAVKKNIIRTLFDSSRMVKANPIIILRALYLKSKYGMNIEDNLSYNMIYYSNRLFKNKYSPDELVFARESIRNECPDADKMFDEYGLWKIKKIR